jgi:hypothetical protein
MKDMSGCFHFTEEGKKIAQVMGPISFSEDILE